MSNLPDEIWTQILELGIHNPNPNTRLTLKDICRISLCCRRVNRLTQEQSIWLSLLSLDFPTRISDPAVSPKLLYKIWFEKEKSRRIAAENRALMRVQSRVSEGFRRVDELRKRRINEGDNVTRVANELNALFKVRQASVALNVWQPEVIRGRQKQIVEQCAVPVDSRINALKMELKLCKQQMAYLEQAYRAELRRLEEAKEQLASMKYRPLPDQSVVKTTNDDHQIPTTVVNQNAKRKKFKRSIDEIEGQVFGV